MGEDEIHYLVQHIITLRQILAVNCGIQVKAFIPDDIYRTNKTPHDGGAELHNV